MKTALTLSALALVTLAGCSALDRRADSRAAAWEAAHPPRGQILIHEGRAVHVHVSGRANGPDVVLIHGANGNLNDFTFDLAARLAPDFRVIAVDRPGLGHSDPISGDEDPRAQARHLRGALAQLNLNRPVVVGHSYGGAVALGWALDHDDTAALVLLGAVTHPWPGRLGIGYRLAENALAARALHTGIGALVPESIADGAMRGVFRPDAVPEGYIAHFAPVLSMRRNSQAINARQVNALNAQIADMQSHYHRLTLPIESLHGTADKIVGLSIHSERLAAELPQVNLIRLQDVGHMPHHARPEETAQAVRRAHARALSLAHP